MNAPIKLIAKVCFTDGDGQTGEATVELGNGVCPTPADIRKYLAEVEELVKDKGYRLMGKDEFVHYLIEEKTGSTERFAIPGGDKWDAWADQDRPVEEATDGE